MIKIGMVIKRLNSIIIILSQGDFTCSLDFNCGKSILGNFIIRIQKASI